MQLNQALFLLGGGSGYVPQPDVMRDDAFDPFDKETLRVEPITIQLQVGSVGASSVVLVKRKKINVRASSGAGGSPPAQERPEHRLSFRGGGNLWSRLRQLQVQDGRRG